MRVEPAGQPPVRWGQKSLGGACHHPLLRFSRAGGRLAAKLHPGNVHSAAGWEELLWPEIEPQPS